MRRLLPLLALLIALAGWAGAARAQITRLPAPDLPAESFFGAAVAIDGARLLVGAPGERTCGPNGGAVYVYVRSEDGTWRLAHRLAPSDCRPNAFFGRSLDLSGTRALVGAVTEFFATEASNAAYVFERDSLARDSAGTWREAARLTVDPQRGEGIFAASVALDGRRALVTAQGEAPAGRRESQRRGAAYLFERSAEGTWHEVAHLVGRARGAGAFGSGGALESDRFAVAASARAAHRPAAVYVFERTPEGTWHEAAYLDDLRGAFIDVALEGGRLLVGASGRAEGGAASLYARQPGGTWARAAMLEPHVPYAPGVFGTAVSLSGDRALVTGYDEQLGLDINIDRVVYVFAYDAEAGTWRQQQIIDIGAVDFAAAMGHDGRTAAISNTPPDAPGEVYVVRLR